MIGVLIIDDLKSAADMIADILNLDSEISVVGKAADKDSALRQLVLLQPRLIVLDSHVGKARGIELAREIMRVRPTPILMTVSAGADLAAPSKGLFVSGVVEVVDKNELYRWRTRPEVAQKFIRKVKMLSRLKNVGSSREKQTPASHLETAETLSPNVPQEKRIIAIVSSTGGPNTLLQILSRLEPDFPLPILLVQHMSKGFIHGFADWLNDWIALTVKVARDNDGILPGEVLVAPDDYHLTVNSQGRVKLVDDPPVRGHRPSGDYLLRSVAEHYGPGALGVVLTGMGQDGAEGMRRLKVFSGKTIAQDEASSIIFGMPKAAVELGVVDQVLSIEGIAEAMTAFAGPSAQET